MSESTFQVYGELREWPTKQSMASLLRDAGLHITVGRYSIRVEDCSRFIIQEYGGDLGDRVIEVDADTNEEIVRDVQRVSRIFASAGLAHRFEVYDEHDQLAHYVHHDWPLRDAK